MRLPVLGPRSRAACALSMCRREMLEERQVAVERGWIQARGEGKGRSWHLSAAAYRLLDAPAGYVRVHGFEPLQQEGKLKLRGERRGSEYVRPAR